MSTPIAQVWNPKNDGKRDRREKRKSKKRNRFHGNSGGIGGWIWDNNPHADIGRTPDDIMSSIEGAISSAVEKRSQESCPEIAQDDMFVHHYDELLKKGVEGDGE